MQFDGRFGSLGCQLGSGSQIGHPVSGQPGLDQFDLGHFALLFVLRGGRGLLLLDQSVVSLGVSLGGGGGFSFLGPGSVLGKLLELAAVNGERGTDGV